MRLWMLLVPAFALVLLVMAIATKVRGTAILNPEDHKQATMIGFAVNFAVFILVSAMTPLEAGWWTLAGLVLIVPSALLYLLSIHALARSSRELVRRGIFRYTRNPMYVAIILFSSAFVLMAVQTWVPGALIMGVCTLVFALLIKVRVRDEEAFLSSEFQSAWLTYSRQTPRYIPGFHKHP
jgi:protein-S-isoprenylcysteine O-methyltransferase Ste14